MDSAFCTLMIVLIAAGVNGIKVLVSIPEGELTEAIKNATKQETKTLKRELKSMKNHESESIAKLERELKSIKALLKQNNGSASKTEPKPKLDPTPELTSEPTPEPDPTTEPEPEQVRKLLPIAGGKAKWTGLPNPTRAIEKVFLNGASHGCSGRSSSTEFKYKTPFPQMIYYEFPEAHVPARLSFRRIDTIITPKTWKFAGSTDEGCNEASTWVELCGDLVGDEIVNNQEVGCDVPAYARKPFKCLGIRVNSINSNNSGYNAVCIKAMRFWEITPRLISRA